MKKRTFLKTSSSLIAGSFLTPMISCKETTENTQAMIRKNWAGNLQYSAKQYYEPNTVEEIQELIKQADKVRFLGTRHCFNTIADSPDTQISLKNFDQIIELDEAAQQVTIGAGIKYGQLCPYLHEKGFAIHNLASLPHISVAGACATATHGSGVGNGNLGTGVAAVEFVNGKGDLVTLSREKDGDRFLGAVVNLGGLGAITKVTLDIEPTYQMRQDVYQYLPMEALADHFDEIMSSGYSVSLFTDYQTDKVNQVWIKRKVEEGVEQSADAEFFGAQLATRDIHPILAISAENCTPQMGLVGPWYERLPHFRMDFTPSSGTELQAEYFVPRENAVQAIQAIQQMGSRLKQLLMISEIRTIKADELWMSTAYRRESVAIHFTLEQDWAALQLLLPDIEKALEPFGARPHWGKMFTLAPSTLQSRYERLSDFKDLLRENDPNGKFSNPFLQKNLYQG